MSRSRSLDDAEPAVGRSLWIVRPDTAEALGYFLSAGVVGLGVGSGLTTDAAGLDLAGLRAALGGRGRVTRPVLALARFLTEISVGDEIGLLVQSGSALMIGTVLGDYEFAAGSGPAPHVRPVRWERIVPRGRRATDRGAPGRPPTLPRPPDRRLTRAAAVRRENSW